MSAAGSVVTTRALALGDGPAVAALWRELWVLHDEWGGYLALRDDDVYTHVAAELDGRGLLRAGAVVHERHAHLVAVLEGAVVGQVEGWFDRYGITTQSPVVCEVRSLVVGEKARGHGVGAVLLARLGAVAAVEARGARCILAAEVLEANPAHAFYMRLGYAPVAWVMSIDVTRPPSDGGVPRCRLATPADALPLASLEMALASRRASVPDPRFEGPGTVDVALVRVIASYIAETQRSEKGPKELVAVDDEGRLLASATLITLPLEPPFVVGQRALLGRFALAPRVAALPALAALVRKGCEHARHRGARSLELTDLTAPGTELHDAAVTIGARSWSQVLCLAT